MNPLTQTLNQLKMNEKELAAGVSGTKSSWHTEYKDSAWIFLGGLPYEMTEGDIICMFSQYGEPVRSEKYIFIVKVLGGPKVVIMNPIGHPPTTTSSYHPVTLL